MQLSVLFGSGTLTVQLSVLTVQLFVLFGSGTLTVLSDDFDDLEFRTFACIC